MPKTFKPDFSKACFLHRFEIYIPVLDNEGQIIPPRLFQRLTAQLMEAFGGVSTMFPYGGSGGIDGIYHSSVSEVVFRDKSAVLMVLSQNDPESVGFFKKNLPKWEKTFKQEKILVMVSDVMSL
ncbi:MAG: hypothetical protein ACKVRN_09575 [Pyrinomonadaceae bacterium]